MKVAMIVVARDETDLVDSQIAFHLNAGVDLVIATDASTDGTTDVLESYVRDGHLLRLPAPDSGHDRDWRASMARLAVDQHGADWVIDAAADEFWMPRAASIKDILVAIPARYGVVQALVRVFLPRPDDGRPFVEQMTVRRPLTDIRRDESMGRLDWALRPIHRASHDLVVGGDREVSLDGKVPLRAWYPIEVLRFPLRSFEQARRRVTLRSGPDEPRSRIEQAVFEAHHQGALQERWRELMVDDEQVVPGQDDGSLVVDERLRTAVRKLEEAAPSQNVPARRFALPVAGNGHLELETPTVVDDVAYAGECAAVREVDFEPLQQRIAEFERRIAVLEARFWPRVRRRVSRLIGR